MGADREPVRRRGPGDAIHAAIQMAPRSGARYEAIRDYVREHDVGALARRPSSQTSTAGLRALPSRERPLARRRRGPPADGRRGREGGLAPPGGRARDADGQAGDGDAAPRAAEGRRRGRGADRRDHGREADERADTALPPACRSRTSTSRSRSASPAVEITASAETTAQTGVEMEALVGASVAALTVYDMAKAIDDSMAVTEVRLLEKTKEPREGGCAHRLRRRRHGHARGQERRRARGAARAEGYEVVRRVVPDERDAIAEAIEELARESRVVLTTGGTGVGPRDVTPEATASVLERLARRESPRRSAPTRSRRLRTACSRVAWRCPRPDARRQSARLDRAVSGRVRRPAACPRARAPPPRGRGDRAPPDVIRARRAREALRDKRVLRGSTSTCRRASSSSSRGRTGRARRRCSGSSRASTAQRAGSSRSRRARPDRLPRPRAARLPRADRPREPRPLRPALPRPRAARADRDAARALRSLGRPQRAGRHVLAAGCCSGSPSAARSCTIPSSCCSTSRSRRSTTRAPTSSHDELAGAAHGRGPSRARSARLAPLATARLRWHDLRRRRRRLARKDLLLELRSRDTLPAMLLFVVSALVVFHFALPADASDRAEIGLFWIAIHLHRAPRPDPRLRPRARAGPARRARAGPGRPQRDLGGEGDLGGARVPRAAEAGRAAGLRALLRAGGLGARRSRRSPTSGSASIGALLAAMAAASRSASCSSRCSSCRSRFPIVVGGVGASVAENPAQVPGFPRPVRRRFCDPCVGQL